MDHRGTHKPVPMIDGMAQCLSWYGISVCLREGLDYQRSLQAILQHGHR